MKAIIAIVAVGFGLSFAAQANDYAAPAHAPAKKKAAHAAKMHHDGAEKTNAPAEETTPKTPAADAAAPVQAH